MVPTESGGLRTIFSFFLGLMLTAFAGVSVYTFHPPPAHFDTERRDLGRREQAIREAKLPDALTDEDRKQIQEINRRQNELADTEEKALKHWGRSTSIILILFATLSMAVSLVRADQLPVISNGLLLAGVFTMLYGVGWIVVTDTSMARFWVMTVALAITLGLGYIRFVRRGTVLPSVSPARVEAVGLLDIERRIRNLEDRMDRAAQAFGHKDDSSESQA
ncbi:MAG: hypothetical protein FJY97_09785 [candidate division Zixibacteria bacterium]|nr:hypothetical protein [candidate division Zixibacteria bacterium]